MTAIFLREVKAFLDSLIGFMVIGVFLVAMGLLFWVFPETSILEYGYADMSSFFQLAPYIFLFLVPAITMKSFAEEYRSGMIEILLTRPVSVFQLIIGKYLASVALIIVSILPTITYCFSIYFLGNPVGNLDLASITGSYVGLILLGSSFAAIGVLSSSLTSNQVVAFILAVFISFVFYSGFNSLANIDVWSSPALALEFISLIYHYDALSKGLIDLQNVIYLLSIAAIGLSLTYYTFERRKW